MRLRDAGIILIVDLRKTLKQQVKAVIRPYLLAQGFDEFTDLAAWRKGERWIDCVEIFPFRVSSHEFYNRLGRRGSEEVVAIAGTFRLDVGVYYTDRHLLPWTGLAPDRPRCLRGDGTKHPTCDRQVTLARSYEFGNVSGTLFPVADDGSDLDAAVADALGALKARGMTWLDSAHDIDAYLARRDQNRNEYVDTEPTEIPMTEDERIEVIAWMAAHGIKEGETFAVLGNNIELPRALQRRRDTADLSDHTAMDIPLPSADLLYSLLVGSGRIDEAKEAMRRDGDTTFAENQYAEALAAGFPKRSANAIRRRTEGYQGEIRAHLVMLEAHLAASDDRQQEQS